jgi:hypothetical protein
MSFTYDIRPPMSFTYDIRLNMSFTYDIRPPMSFTYDIRPPTSFSYYILPPRRVLLAAYKYRVLYYTSWEVVFYARRLLRVTNHFTCTYESGARSTARSFPVV